MKRPAWLRRKRKPSARERSAAEAWQSAIDGEVRFWREYLRTKGARYPGSYETRLNPDLPLQPEIAALLDAPEGSTVRLLDVGAGPLTFLGRKDPRYTLELTAVDALGTQYGELLDEAGVVPPVRTQTCESEKLTTVLSRDHFDLVAARNTLDHSYDPMRAIEEMVAVAKPGAPLLLIHHRNTAEDEDYHGMHQWNFEADDGRLAVWRPGERIDVGEALAGRAVVERTWVEGAWEHTVLRKTAAAPGAAAGQPST